MQVNFDSQYKLLRIPGYNLSRQYICRNPKLVFTIVHREEWNEDFVKHAHRLVERDGVYAGIGDDDIYIGLSDRNKNGILGRIADHFKDKKKNDIKFFIVITSYEKSDEDYDTNIITSLEHILRQMAVYSDRVNVLNTGTTHYIIKNDIFKITDFLRCYGVIHEMLTDRNINYLTPLDTRIALVDSPDVYTLGNKLNLVKLKVCKDSTKVILKNSTFELPLNLISDDSSADALFRRLLRENIITIAPPINAGPAKLVFMRDLVCDKINRIDDLTSFLLNRSVSDYEEMWMNSEDDLLSER